MKQQQIARLSLQTQIWASGKSWIFWLASVLLVFSGVMGLLVTPGMAQRIEALAHLISLQSPLPRIKERPSTVLPATPANTITSAEATFYGLLVDENADDRVIQQLFHLAELQSLTLADVSYHYALNTDGQFMELAVEAPIKGPYAQIVRFCESVLTALPNAALDTVNFKREHISDTEVEAKARFIIYMKPAVGKPARTSS